MWNLESYEFLFSFYLKAVPKITQPPKHGFVSITLEVVGHGGSSSGRISDFELRGPEFDPHWELGAFSLSFLSRSISGAS